MSKTITEKRGNLREGNVKKGGVNTGSSQNKPDVKPQGQTPKKTAGSPGTGLAKR